MNKRAPLIAAGVAVLLVALTYMFLVKPKMAQVATAKDTLAQKQSETATLQTLLATLRDDQANASKFQDTIDMVDQKVPPILDQQGILALLRLTAEQAGVDHLTVSFGSTSLSLSGVSVVPVSVTIQGRYFTIAQFFSKIEALPRAAKVVQFTLSPGGSLIAGPAPPGTMQLQASIEFFTTDASAGPGSDPGPQSASSLVPPPVPAPAIPSGAP